MQKFWAKQAMLLVVLKATAWLVLLQQGYSKAKSVKHFESKFYLQFYIQNSIIQQFSSHIATFY